MVIHHIVIYHIMLDHIGFRDKPEDEITGRMLRKAVARLQFSPPFQFLNRTDRKGQGGDSFSVRTAVTLCTPVSDRTAYMNCTIHNIYDDKNVGNTKTPYQIPDLFYRTCIDVHLL